MLPLKAEGACVTFLYLLYASFIGRMFSRPSFILDFVKPVTMSPEQGFKQADEPGFILSTHSRSFEEEQSGS